MSTVTQYPPDRRFLMHDVSWEAYEQLLADQNDHGVRMTYDRGRLELMSPSDVHEQFKTLLGRFIETLTLELRIPVRSGGSTTLRRELLKKGLEPDECYYIRSEAAVRGLDSLDLERDPPPDLAVEVDITSSSIDRMPIYAALGVPEVWRFDGERLTVFELNETGEYATVSRSPNLPMIVPGDFVRFLERRTETDETTLIGEFRGWVCETLMSGDEKGG